MAPKRKAPPRPPPPPVPSDDETASGSGSEEEEEIAHSPPPAAPKSVAPPPQKDKESEASDEDEDGEEEEEDVDDEEDEKANQVIPSSATKKPPPPPPTREESETSDEQEEADDEMPPQTKPAPSQEMAAKGAKRQRPSALFQRTWSTDDELRILEALAAHRLEQGKLPQTDVLAKALTGKLDNSGCSLPELQRKVKSLQSRYIKAAKKGALPSNDDDRRLFDLSKNVWPTKVATKKAVATGGAGREPDEMCELYPYLAEEVMALQKTHPGVFKREFAMIDDSKARALDEKIKKQRYARMKIYMRGHDLTKEVMKTLMDLAE